MLNSNAQRTGDQALVRQINLSLIMHSLRKNAPLSRASLAEITGLNRTTVSSLVNELIENQYVREIGFETGAPGRPGRLLTLDPDAGYILSCEIGVDFISVIGTDFARQNMRQHQDRINPDMGQHAIINRALALLHKAEDHGNGTGKAILGVALGVPGLVDPVEGTLLFAPNLGWRNVSLFPFFQGEFNAPVFVDNEANMAALGEYYFGAAQGYLEMLYISAGVGLGGGIVHGGRLFSGVSWSGSEFGHMTMDPEGEKCNCGNQGCWETQVSQAALFRYIAAAMQHQPSIISELTKNDLSKLTVPITVEAAQAGDQVAVNALAKVGRYLGIGIASLVNAFNPELVVFGGILSLASDFLLPIVEEELEHRALEWNQQATKVVRAHHGFNACVMGGVAAVYQAILAEPGSIRNQVKLGV